MAIAPQQFFNFTASHFELVISIYHAQNGLSEAELLSMIRRYIPQESMSANHALERLRTFGIIEPLPDATTLYEMSRPLHTLLTHLFSEQRLVSPEVIKAYLVDLESLGSELDNDIQKQNGAHVVHVLNDLGNTTERMRQEARANRLGIVNETVKLKTNDKRLTVRERFETVNRLWERYIVPVRDLIDIHKAMEPTLDHIERALQHGAFEFRLDGALYREFSRALARFVRMRKDVYADYRESSREVEPLYNALRRDTDLARAATFVLREVSRNGAASLSLEDRFSIPVHRLEGIFDDAAHRAYLHGLAGYEPAAVPRIAAYDDDQSNKDFINTDAVHEALGDALPVDDALAWLGGSYPNATLREILRAYNRIFQDPPGDAQFAGEPRDYEVGGVRLQAFPMAVSPVETTTSRSIIPE